MSVCVSVCVCLMGVCWPSRAWPSLACSTNVCESLFPVSQHLWLTHGGFELWGMEEEEEEKLTKGLVCCFSDAAVFSGHKRKWLIPGHFHEWLTEVTQSESSLESLNLKLNPLLCLFSHC